MCAVVRECGFAREGESQVRDNTQQTVSSSLLSTAAAEGRNAQQREMTAPDVSLSPTRRHATLGQRVP